MGTFHKHKFRGCNCDYLNLIMSCDMADWYPLILVCILTKFGGCSLLESCASKFLNSTWSHDCITLHVVMVVFHSDIYSHHVWWLQSSWKLRIFQRSHKTWSTYSILFETLAWWYKKLVVKSKAVITKWYRKQLLQSYYKVPQKFTTKCVRYYEVWQKFLTNCVRYYKVWQCDSLQIARNCMFLGLFYSSMGSFEEKLIEK